MRQRQVIVAGGGASGLVAAITAARNGASVTIIEQKELLGKKLLSTGNGRCNFTNACMSENHFRGDYTSIVSGVLSQFGYEDTLLFFEQLGVLSKSRNGYIYPMSDQASAILEVLCMEINRLGITVRLGERVSYAKKKKQGFVAKTDCAAYEGDALILATGGKAASVLGSDGSGYTLAKSFGHSLSPVVPALVQLRCKGGFFHQLSGVRTQANIDLYVDGCHVASDTGELQLTNYGISGIPVFQVSRFAAKALHEKKKVMAVVDFLPNMPFDTFSDYLTERMREHAERSAEEFLVGMFPKKLIGVLLREAGIGLHQPMSQVTKQQVQQLAKACRSFEMVVEGTNDFEQAQVCAGGVRTSELHADTMESVYVEGLYFTGELLDIDGICGGYNLQWAWATGYLAGFHAAKKVRSN